MWTPEKPRRDRGVFLVVVFSITPYTLDKNPSTATTQCLRLQWPFHPCSHPFFNHSACTGAEAHPSITGWRRVHLGRVVSSSRGWRLNPLQRWARAEVLFVCRFQLNVSGFLVYVCFTFTCVAIMWQQWLWPLAHVPPISKQVIPKSEWTSVQSLKKIPPNALELPRCQRRPGGTDGQTGIAGFPPTETEK